MNNDDQMNSYMSTTQNYGVSCSNDMSSKPGGFSVKSMSSLLKVALFIISQGTYRQNDISTRTRHSIDRLIDEFDDITNRKENSFEFYRGLIETYENLFGIYLCLIADYGGTYTIVDRSYFPDTNKQQFNQNPYAFIYYNMKENKYSPLYKEMDGCISTIFSEFDNSVWNHAQSFVDQLNKNVIYSNQNQADHLYNLQEEDSDHMVIDDTHATTNQPSESTITHEIISTASAVIEQMVQEIVLLIPNFGARLDSIVYQNDIVENDNETMPSTVVTEDQNQSNLPTNLSPTTNASQSRRATTSTPLRQKSPPKITTQPKPTWDYRTMRDLWKKELPLLAGVGSQRTPIRVKVPSKSDGQMYLGVKVLNLKQEEHGSK
ncbi:hypothetical protein I4U23_030251 [Adineta vaga]|nr:hypothetical protein I4U23_030251 [Adineta vaga]